MVYGIIRKTSIKSKGSVSLQNDLGTNMFSDPHDKATADKKLNMISRYISYS